jgi:hypothetical protein
MLVYFTRWCIVMVQQPEDETNNNTCAPIRLFLEKILTALLRK